MVQISSCGGKYPKGVGVIYQKPLNNVESPRSLALASNFYNDPADGAVRGYMLHSQDRYWLTEDNFDGSPRIIDVSSNNGQLDWDTIKSSIDGVIIRIGYGSDIENQDDSQAIRNMQECERLGIPYGVYIYSYCLNIEEVRSEAAHILRMIQGFNPVLGVWFDMEDADGYKRNHGLVPEQNGELLTDFCIEFMQIVKDAGYTTGVYANYSYFTNVLNDGRLMSFEGFNRWLAHWGIDEPSMDCLLWQCTSDAVIDGSSARTDFNYYYGELPNVEPIIPSEPIEDNERCVRKIPCCN